MLLTISTLLLFTFFCDSANFSYSTDSILKSYEINNYLVGISKLKFY